MTQRENYLRNATFNSPERIPIIANVSLASLIQYKDEMEKVMVKYPEYFGDFVPGSIDYSQYGDGYCSLSEKDAWGYTWNYSVHGLEGFVTDHPLDSWDKLDTYTPPDSNIWRDRGGKYDWDKIKETMRKRRESGILTAGGLVHGFLFLRLQYLRGFENLMYDMYDEEPKLFELIEMIDRENLKIVKNYCNAKVDVMEIPEDLGAEHSMVISREMFHKYIEPSYRKITSLCKEHNILTMIHSDGYIVDILEDLMAVGMDIINPQDLVNGVDNLKRILKGKVCIRLDVDRSKITPRANRNEIFELIEYEVKELGSPKGGLEFIYGVYPPTPPDAVAYVCEAFKKYERYWF
ncbi:MAG TPA: hypothetical protein GX701_03240 [Clostridiales bacterium]|nr:hypothetical protein [Clostridiales bacterium]